MTTEDKAKAYADKKYGEETKVWHFGDEVHEMLMDAYEAGAKEALRSQWKDASKELPERHQEVFVATDSNNCHKFGLAWIDTRTNGSLRWYSADEYLNTNAIRFWMELPPLPNTEEQ